MKTILAMILLFISTFATSKFCKYVRDSVLSNNVDVTDIELRIRRTMRGYIESIRDSVIDRPSSMNFSSTETIHMR